MLIDFEQLDETEIKNFYGGTQSTYARMFADAAGNEWLGAQTIALAGGGSLMPA